MNDLAAVAKVEIFDEFKAALADDQSLHQCAKLIDVKSIDYLFYKKLVKKCPEAIKKFLTMDVFLILANPKTHEVEREDLIRFIQRTIDVDQTTLQLLSFAQESSSGSSPAHEGYVNEKELERFIYNSIPEMIGKKEMPESFYPFYVFTSARRFFFFLDSERCRKLNINNLSHSNVMEEFLFIKRLVQYERDVTSSTIPASINFSNWFSSDNARSVYSTYIELDKDRNGMLSQRELIGLTSCGMPPGPCQLTSAAITRIFEEYITYTPKEMDYKTYLDLILALEDKSHPQSLAYFWRVLDIDKSGRLSSKVVEYFYKDIFNCLKVLSYEAPTMKNITTEIYDILGCEDARGPTLEEFVNSGQGHTVITMLLDVHGFWSYDNRESLLQQQQQQEATAENLDEYDLDSTQPRTGVGLVTAPADSNSKKEVDEDYIDDFYA